MEKNLLDIITFISEKGYKILDFHFDSDDLYLTTHVIHDGVCVFVTLNEESVSVENFEQFFNCKYKERSS